MKAWFSKLWKESIRHSKKEIYSGKAYLKKNLEYITLHLKELEKEKHKQNPKSVQGKK